MNTSAGQWWNDAVGGKPTYWEKRVAQCHVDCYKSHMDWTEIEPGRPRWEAGNCILHYIYIYKLILYLTENAVYFHLYNHPVKAVQGNSKCLLREAYGTHNVYLFAISKRNCGYGFHSVFIKFIYIAQKEKLILCIFLKIYQHIKF